MKSEGIHQKNLEAAVRFGASDRTIRQWRKDQKPVDNEVEMANLIMVDPRANQRMRDAAEKILAEAIETGENSEVGGDSSVDPDWKEIMEGSSAESMDASTVDRLRKLRTFFMAKLEKATKLNNISGIKLYTDQVIALENAIGKNQLLAKRLGIDAGDLMKREDVERFLGSLAFLLLRGVDDELDELCPLLTEQKSPEDVRPILESHKLSTRFLRPFRGVIEQRSGLGLPHWFVEKLVSSADDFVEEARGQLVTI